MKLWKTINAGFAALFLMIIILSAYGIYEYLKGMNIPGIPFAVIVILDAAVVAAGFGISLIYIKIEKLIASHNPERLFKGLIYGGTFLLLCLAICAGFTAKPVRMHDLGYICTAAKNLLFEGVESLHNGLPERHSNYFYVYPNNQTILMLIYGLYKIEYALTGEINNVLPILLNATGLALSYFLFCKCARLLWSAEKACVYCIKGFVFSPLISYAAFFYTDALAMPWVMGAAYLYVKMRSKDDKEISEKKSLVFIGLVGAFLGVAFKIKTTPVIFLVAVVIDMFVRRKNFKSFVKRFASIIMCFAAVSLIIGYSAGRIIELDKVRLEKYKFPAIHWVMMSADGKGNFNKADFMYTYSHYGYENKIKADTDRLIDKLDKQGFLGTIRHVVVKLSFAWRGGAFMSGYYYNGFFKSVPWYTFAFLFYYAALFSICKGLFAGIHRKNDMLSCNFVFRLTLIGVTFFFIIWEAKSRYLVTFFLLFLLI